MRQFILCACLLQTVLAAPQFITFKDGRVGVNFGGYHAEAGLGGLLTGNAADGGLSASAGTPHGQNAAAGLGGRVGERSSGFLYAGAQATPQVGASSVLGGSTDGQGFGGSEAYANGKVHSKTKYVDTLAPVPGGPAPVSSDETYSRPATETNVVQKVKSSYPKKHTLLKSAPPTTDSSANVVYTKHVRKSVHSLPPPVTGNGEVSVESHGHVSGGTNIVNSALNIPIGILRSLQESLSGLRGETQASFYKTKRIGHTDVSHER